MNFQKILTILSLLLLNILCNGHSSYVLANAEEEEFVSEQATVEGFFAGDFIRVESRVKSKCHFYSNPDLKFVAGKKVDLVVTLQNNAKSVEFVVDRIRASTRSAHMWHLLYQNYTGRKYEDALPPGFQGSYHYSFTPDETLDPREYGLVVLAEFHDLTGRKYVHPVFNATYEIVDTESVFDFKTIFMFAVFIGSFFLISSVLQMKAPGDQFVPSGTAAAKSSNKKVYKPKKGGAASGAGTDDWLTDTNFKQKSN